MLTDEQLVVLIDCGHELFRDSPKTCPITFIVGDVFDDSFCSLNPPDNKIPAQLPESCPEDPPKDLYGLHGRATCLYAGSLFHLFDQETQLSLARRLASLLSIPTRTAGGRPVSALIFGRHVGRTEAGLMNDRPGSRFAHSAESWTKLWEEDVFGPKEDGKVDSNGDGTLRIRVMAKPLDWGAERRRIEREISRMVRSEKTIFLQWSVEVWREKV
jgi:hypothetical protein